MEFEKYGVSSTVASSKIERHRWLRPNPLRPQAITRPLKGIENRKPFLKEALNLLRLGLLKNGEIS
ncbi:hypothetical protein [uncultured Phascolarctobacterium sp.]|jgi:hypothetical protein|uniref:hypothetical protein n=1 Tax=uncultured Phascolarctobacterium sp. TaxID=512296 RepID=UPI0025DDB704|nr:hypothetical protein [uncultured Phascolarctobacterium sp.]